MFFTVIATSLHRSVFERNNTEWIVGSQQKGVTWMNQTARFGPAAYTTLTLLMCSWKVIDRMHFIQSELMEREGRKVKTSWVI